MSERDEAEGPEPRQNHDGEGDPTTLPPVQEVQRTLRQFATFRSAQRALAPSVASLRDDAVQEAGQALRKRLEQLAETWKALDKIGRPDPAKVRAVAAGLAEVTSEVATRAEELRELADRIDPPQLRSTLPEIARRHRKEVCALLDLLIEDEAGLERRRGTIEYLVTLLTTTDDDGKRKIAHDPARLTPAMHALCERLAIEHADVPQDVELAFFQAAEADERDVIAHVRELREKKEELGVACFVPGVLRAIVTYNARMANRMSSVVSSAREADLAFEDFVDADLDGGAGPGLDEEIPLDFAGDDMVAEMVDAISILESSAVDQIRDAVSRKLRSVPIGNDAAERVALAVDLKPLGEPELALLGTTEPTEDERLMASVLLVGLMSAVQPVIEPSLAELGIASKHLREDWPTELDRALQKRIQELVTSNGYEQACILSEFKTKHLYESISNIARERRGREGLRKKTEKHDSAASKMLAFAREAQAELGGFRKGDWVGPVSLIVYGKGTGRQIRSALVSMVAVGILVFGGINLISGDETDVAELRPRQLSDISRYLKSAYRNDKGSGQLVIGQIDEAWYDLEGDERLEAAHEIREAFLEANVSDAMIYGARNQLLVYLASGELRKPTKPEAPEEGAD